MKNSFVFIFSVLAGVFLFCPFLTLGASDQKVMFNEIAWMGTDASSYGEWLELYNASTTEANVDGWGIYKKDQKAGDILVISLTGSITANGYYLIERTTDSSPDPIVNTVADLSGKFGGGGLSNDGEYLLLKGASGSIIDEINFSLGWSAGCSSVAKSNSLPECRDGQPYRTMEKDSLVIGAGWHTNGGEIRNGADAKGNLINGTPRAANSLKSDESGSTADNTATTTDSLFVQAPTATSQSPSLFADAGGSIVAIVSEDVFFDGSKSRGSGTLSFLWNFGDGATKEGEKITHQYAFPGVYVATLKVSDGVQFKESQSRVDIYSDSVNISEFLSNPSASENQWIELSNRSSYSIDISGWGLGVKDSAPFFKLPENTFLASNGFLVLSKDTTGLSLPESNGLVYLFYPNGQIAGKVEYKNARQGVSASLVQGGQFMWTEQKTPGAKNIVVSSATPEKNVESFNVLMNDEATAGAVRTKSLFVEYKKYEGVKSFIVEPAFAYTVGEVESTQQNASDNDLSGTASSYGAFSRLWFWALVIGGVATLFFILRKIFTAK